MEQGAGGGGASAIFSFMQSLMDRSDVPSPSPLTSGSQSPLLTPPVSMAASAERSLSLSPVVQSVLLQHSNGEVASEQAKLDKNRLDYKSEEYRQLFHLPPEEVLVEDFNCALQKKILLQGHMYLFERYVCFYSNIFGYEKKKIIPLKDVTCVRKAKTAQVFPNAIEITAWGKKHFFASFLSRDEAYRLIVNGWSHHSAYARIYLGSHASQTPQGSPGLSPRPTGLAFSESATMAEPPMPPRSLLGDGGFGSRDIEEVRSSAAPSVAEEDAERTSSQGLNDRMEADSSLEGISVKSGPSANLNFNPRWEVSDSEAPELPDVFKTVTEAEFPIDVSEFFRLFFSNEAIGFLKKVHTKCGDEEFRCTQWAKHHHFGHARDVSFRYPINFVFGPKATYCHETQRFRVYQNSHLVLESAQQMADIPYGDYFHVQVRWDVQKVVGGGTTGCFARISLHVPFSKKTLWKSKIEQGTFDGCKEAFSTWISEAHAVLQELASTSSANSEPSSVSREPEVVLQSLPGSEDSRGLFAEPELSVEGFQDSPSCLVNHVATERTAPEVDDVLDLRSGHELQERPSTSGDLRTSHGSRALGSKAFYGFAGELEHQRQTSRQRMVDLRQILADWCPAALKSWSQPKLVIIFIILILLLQVYMMVALARPRSVQYLPAGYPSSSFGSAFGGTSGMCSSSSRQEEMSWIEQRARFMKDEVAMAEARLQTMRHDLAVLKMHLQHFQKSNPQLDLDLPT